jgi:predicted MPP superfamily phosphohydrolase
MPFFLRVIIAVLIIVVLEFYFFKKVFNSIIVLYPKFSIKKAKLIRNAVLFYLNIYPLILICLYIYSLIIPGTRIILPENFFFDYLILYPFWLAIIVLVQTILFLLIIDIIKIILYPLYKKYKDRLSILNAKLIFALVVFFSIYVPARSIHDHNFVSIRIVEYSKNQLPEVLKNFRIAFIADTQGDRFTGERRLQRFVSKVNKTNPDLVLIAGDIITSSPDYIDISASALGKIKSNYGVYSCVGDHDNWAYRGDNQRSIYEIKEALNEQNILMLDNERLVLNIEDAKVGITFITNTYVERINADVLDSLSDKPGHYDLKIFLTHQPRKYLIDAAVKHDYDLFLAGHTHGGQITFLFPFYNLSPTLIETTYVRGNFWFDDMLMIVTRGLGMSLVPLRYNSTPEVTLIVITENTDK